MGATWRGRSPSAERLSRELDPDGTLAAIGHVGLITFKDCKAASPVRWASRHTARATSHGCAGAMRSQDCDVLLVVGTPTLRPADAARLARAYYHADLQLIDETSVRGEDGRWRYREPRMRAEWPIRSAVPS